MSRAGWDLTWQRVAEAVAARSRCGLRVVGAVIVSGDNRQHWVGYNGPPPGLPVLAASCLRWCPQAAGPDGQGACVSVHAEINALMQSDRVPRAGGTFYASQAPCWKCALAIAGSGAARLVTRPWEQDRAALGAECRNMLLDCGVGVSTDWRAEPC